MVTEQETLIYIEDQDKHNASVAANAFAHKDVKNRAYINTLGAELALKYLASENIDISNIHNIHSIKKILEEIDISDIMLSNIHIDVRVVFDENAIFIPKSHFEYNLVPDIYLVLNLAKDFSHVKFLGFFEPKLINKNNANEQYYFIEKEKLSPVKDLKHYIETFNGNTYENLDEKDLTKCERIIISMADNDISEIDKRYLIKQLTKSAELRDKFLEYENFETLSYKAMTDPQVKRKEPEENISVDDALSQLENFTETNTQEALDTLVSNKTDDIETPAETGSDDLLNEISEAVIDGTAAIAGAAAAETLTDITDDTSHIIDTAIAGINLAEAGFDTENKPEDNEKILDSASAISFDNVDTSELDNITAESENIDEQPISLNDVEVPQETVQTDFIDTIDNKISFDDIPSPETLETPLPLNLDEEKISLDKALREFEFALLDSLGYGIRFEDKDGNALQSGSFYHFLPDSGFIKVSDCKSVSESVEFSEVFSGEKLIMLLNKQYLSIDVLKCAQRITNKALSILLNNKEIKSRAYYRAFLQSKDK